jgi:hypothetical protein
MFVVTLGTELNAETAEDAENSTISSASSAISAFQYFWRLKRRLCGCFPEHSLAERPFYYPSISSRAARIPGHKEAQKLTKMDLHFVHCCASLWLPPFRLWLRLSRGEISGPGRFRSFVSHN